MTKLLATYGAAAGLWLPSKVKPPCYSPPLSEVAMLHHTKAAAAVLAIGLAAAGIAGCHNDDNAPATTTNTTNPDGRVTVTKTVHPTDVARSNLNKATDKAKKDVDDLRKDANDTLNDVRDNFRETVTVTETPAP
ncbi:hypothetical protein [Lawsonella clevelandensis]|nr:hypothetical protein [Lawsonella clevelandensis]MDU7192978.1 hypothetical protein [Lawsonella clevelandensis]